MYLDHHNRASKLSLLSDLKKLKVKVSSIWFLFCKERMDGICKLIDGTCASLNILDDIFEKWDHFSGRHGFPVPHPDAKRTPWEAYSRLPKWRGKYGKLRRELLDFCIQELERDLK